MQDRYSLIPLRWLRRFAVWFWNEPLFFVRFLTAFAVLAPIALLIRWVA